MPLSGSADFSLTAREVITFALRKCNIVGLNQDPSAAAAEDARLALNLMLKTWGVTGPHLWKTVDGAVTLTNATPSYNLAATLNPLRVISARYRNASGNDLPMISLVREEYSDLPIKTSAGPPNQYYFDPQRSAPTLFVWPVLAVVTTETLQVTYQKRFDDLDALDDDIDVAQEWLETVGYNLASRLLDDYPVDGKEADRIVARAEMMRLEAKDFDREDTVVFWPDQHR